jgi:hypothetical protein
VCWDYDDPTDYDEDRDPCDHENYDVDILDGRAHCYRCGEVWCLTREELKIECSRQAEQYEAIAEEFADGTDVPNPSGSRAAQ